MKMFIRKKILQEEDVENDEEKKNREIRRISDLSNKDKPIQKELHEADTTKNIEFAKEVDDFEDGR